MNRAFGSDGTTTLEAPVRIHSSGWRLTWVARIGFVFVAVFVAWYYYFLFGPPWTSRFTEVSAVTGVVGFILLYALVVSSDVRWIELESSGLRVRYLFGTATVPWDRLRASTRPSPWGVTAVGFEDSAPSKIVGSRIHRLTPSQARAVSEYARFNPRAPPPTAPRTSSN